MSGFKNKFFLILAGNMFLITSLYSQCSERISITTDRDLYFSGENLWYKVDCIKGGTSQPSPLSKVAYLELYNTSGTAVMQAKLFLFDGQTNSRMVLPDTLSTGNYFLAGYTNWMKNYGSQVYASKMISIINPFQKGVFAALSGINPIMKEAGNKSGDNSLIVEQLHDKYKSRSLVEMVLKYNQDLKYVTVSVARKALLYERSKNTSDPEGLAETDYFTSQLKNPPAFLPEPEGKIVSGIIVNRSDNMPLANEVVTLSFVSRVPYLYLSHTDNSGRFRFAVNQFGGKEMVIQPLWADTSGKGFMVELDPSFVSNLTFKGTGTTSLNDSSIAEISKCIVNMQVEALYSTVLRRNYVSLPVKKSYSFFNDPPISTVLDKYIELPTMSEVFKEIVPSVGVRERKNVNSFRVVGSNGLYVNYFAIVDGVQIKDINRIIAMNPEEIKQIEVLDLRYFFKDQELGAIISIQTKKGDLSAMNFDNRIFRQEYSGYEYSYAFQSPDYSIDSIYQSKTADFRNLLYWNPEVKIAKEGTHIRFSTSDDTGDYIVSLEGITQEGKKVRYEMPFSVSDK
jgi:hypothetical protein